MSLVWEYLDKLEKKMGKSLGCPNNPLLVSVRSGAPISMPGMMDTILNLGLNSQTVLGLIKLTKNERFCWDSFRRFIHMFGTTAVNIPHKLFEEKLEHMKKSKGI